MKGKLLVLGLFMLSMNACSQDLLEYNSGDLRISVEKGDEYFHNFSLPLGLKKKNPPQMAIWVEDMNGNYVSTIYVTNKIATQSWMMSGGNRRKEALPHWCYSRGVKYDDGLYLPTKKEPLTDGISGATPKESFNMKIAPTGKLRKFVVKIEVNHSTDWNDAYPKSAKEGEAGYSGGKEGSGQPAVVYAANVDLDSGSKSFEAKLVGHSSVDGSDGEVVSDVSSLTTALHIIKCITINVE